MQKSQFTIKEVTFYCHRLKCYNQLSNQQYLKITEVQYYFTEMTKLFLRKQGVTPTGLIADFSSQYVKGEHVLLKSNSHIQAIPMNKLCFLVNLGRVFNLTEDKLGYDFLQFLRLLCSDFPKLIVIKSLRMIKGDWHSEDDQILSMQYNGNTFIASLFVNFLFEEFLNSIEESALQDCTVENVAKSILQFYENHNTTEENMTRPPLSIVFEVLVACSDWPDREFNTNLVQFTESLMRELVKGNKNKISINDFKKKLFEHKYLQRIVAEHVNFVERSNNKIKEVGRILTEKPEDLFPPEEPPAKKKSKKKKE